MRSAVRPSKKLSPIRHPAQPVDVASGVLDSGQTRLDSRTPTAAVDLDRGLAPPDAHTTRAPVDSLPPASRRSMPRVDASGADLATDLPRNGSQEMNVGGVLDGDQGLDETQLDLVAVSEGNGHPARDAHPGSADPSDALLLILADRLNDMEGLRKATANQLSALTRSADIQGGKGLSEHSKVAVSMADWLALLEKEEHKVVLQLQRALRQHPLGRWVKDTVGIGEKQGARLIAAIGDPYWNHAEGRPRRGPAELWAYCGYAPGQKRRRGVQSNWNAEAKMRAYLCAESCIKQTGDADGATTSNGGTRRRSPYRDVYDAARANWAERDTSDAHKHAHGLRCVAKAILKDLWLAARAIRLADPTPEPPVSANGGDGR